MEDFQGMKTSPRQTREMGLKEYVEVYLQANLGSLLRLSKRPGSAAVLRRGATSKPNESRGGPASTLSMKKITC